MKSNAEGDQKFHSFLKEWKERNRQGRPGRLSHIDKWERKIQANPYCLHPEELSALRHAGFPLAHLDASWIDQYLKLWAYKRKHGHCRVPTAKCGDFGRWVATQRESHRLGRMSPQRQLALNRLQFCWDTKEDSWQASFLELARFADQHGHANVPKGSRSFHKSASFLHRQRQLYRRGRLDPEHQQALEALGVVWLPYQDTWNNRLAELKRFVKQHGHANVPNGSRSFSITARFLQHQRRLYRQGRLDLKRQKTLEALGVVWLPHQDAWNVGLAELKRFIKQHGHANIPYQSPAGFRRASKFLYHKRTLYSQGRLDPKRQKVLEALGVVWKQREAAMEDNWKRNITDLKRFIEQHGHANVPQKSPSFERVASFLQRARVHYRQGRLDPKRQKVLEAMGVVWSPLEDVWNSSLAELKRFIKEHGHAHVSRSNPSFRQTAQFLSLQRKLYRQKRLDPKRQKELEALGVAWSPLEDAWNSRLADLKRFIKQHGHARVSSGDPSFRRTAQFLELQRHRYHKGQLDPKRQKELEALGVAWSPLEDVWNSRLADLKRFIEQHGHARVPKGNPSFRQTAEFLQFQRKLYRKGRLDPKRQKKLKALGVCWPPEGSID